MTKQELAEVSIAVSTAGSIEDAQFYGRVCDVPWGHLTPEGYLTDAIVAVVTAVDVCDLVLGPENFAAFVVALGRGIRRHNYAAQSIIDHTRNLEAQKNAG